MQLLFATRNRHKLREVAALIGAELITLADVGLDAELPEEGTLERYPSFAANALAKARFFADRTGRPCVADDSGIVVDALAGAPGVRSRRFSARDDLSGDELDEANNQLLLVRLAGTAAPHRSARYVCVAALALPAGISAFALGALEGSIAPEPAGTAGFGYDPLFIPAGESRTVAQLHPEAKRRWSHRARAFRALAAQLPLLLR
jgi:XTP/dITP diphosphohydrolase